MTIKKISVMAAAIVAGAVLVTGCSPSVENNGGSGTENTAEKRVYYSSVAEPKGALTVTVQGGSAVGVFKSEGKEYRGEGAIESEGAIALELGSEADGATKYSFKGSYDGEKKAFTKGQFGKAGGELKEVVLSSEKKASTVRPFYYGKVYPSGLYAYEVTITRKSDSAVAILFARQVVEEKKASSTDDTQVGVDLDKVYVAVEGTLSGDKVKSVGKVRLEGEEFDFETVLTADGQLRETRLIGDRGFTGRWEPTLIKEYEAKGVGLVAANVKNADASFKGDLTVTLHLSKATLGMLRQQVKDSPGKAADADKIEIGEVFVTFHELTAAGATRMFKGRRKVTKGEYEKAGLTINLYNLLDRQSQVHETTVPTKKEETTIKSDGRLVEYILIAKKGWYNEVSESFKGMQFGRADKSGTKIRGNGDDVSAKLKPVVVK